MATIVNNIYVSEGVLQIHAERRISGKVCLCGGFWISLLGFCFITMQQLLIIFIKTQNYLLINCWVEILSGEKIMACCLYHLINFFINFIIYNKVKSTMEIMWKNIGRELSRRKN